MNKTWDSLHIVCRMTGAGKGTAMGLAEVNIKTVLGRLVNFDWIPNIFTGFENAPNTKYIWKWTKYKYQIPLISHYYSNSQIVRINRLNTDQDHPEWEIEACFLCQDQYEYVATVIERSSNATRMVTFPTPDFNLSQLEPGTNYSIQLFAQNKIGEYNKVFLLCQLFFKALRLVYATNIICVSLSLSYQHSRHNGVGLTRLGCSLMRSSLGWS